MLSILLISNSLQSIFTVVGVCLHFSAFGEERQHKVDLPPNVACGHRAPCTALPVSVCSVYS